MTRILLAGALTLGSAIGSSIGLAGRTPAAVTAPTRLVASGLYDDHGAVRAENRRFAPQYPLWTDGMTKKRWVYLPPGTFIDTSNEHNWQFPVGTRFWKEFSLDGRRVETRMLWRASESQWVFASYIWNDAGTDAVLAAADGELRVAEVAPGRWHNVPSRNDCATCHGTSAKPLGFNALQLSTDRDPNAIHGEPLARGMITVEDLVREGRFAPPREALVTNPPRIRTRSPQTRAALGYLLANCGSCHNRGSDIGVAAPTLNDDELLKDGDAVARGLLDKPTRWQAPGTGEGHSVVIKPGVPDQSALLLRMRSRAPSSQMPPLGTALRDQKAVEFIAAWIER